jgi:hypothetical protein
MPAADDIKLEFERNAKHYTFKKGDVVFFIIPLNKRDYIVKDKFDRELSGVLIGMTAVKDFIRAYEVGE